MKIKKIQFKLTAIFFFLVLLLTACNNSTPDKTISGTEKTTPSIMWGGPKNIAMLPIIAQQNGLFTKNGLTADYTYLQTGKITMDAVIRGEIQFGIIVEATIAFAAFQPSLDIEIIAINQEKYDDAIIARKDKGLLTPKDLVGKRLGITRGTNSQMFAFKLMEKYGIEPASVDIVNLSPPAIVAALNNAEIDAGSVWQPFRYNLMQQLGDKANHIKNDGLYRGFAIIVVNKNYAKQNPDTVKRFLSSLIDAEAYIIANKKSSIKTIAKEIIIEPALLTKLWGEYSVKVSLVSELVTAMEQEGQWIIDNEKGFNNKTLPSYSSLVNTLFLQQIDKMRLTVH